MSELNNKLKNQLVFLYNKLSTIQENLSDIGFVYGKLNNSATETITALRTTNNNQSEPSATEFLLTELTNISQADFLKALIEIINTIDRLEGKEEN